MAPRDRVQEVLKRGERISFAGLVPAASARTGRDVLAILGDGVAGPSGNAIVVDGRSWWKAERRLTQRQKVKSYKGPTSEGRKREARK